MGHMYLANISRRVNKELKMGPISITRLADKLEKGRIEVSCAEGGYTDRYMLSWATSLVIQFLYDEAKISPIMTTREQRVVFNEWKEGCIEEWDDGEDGKSGKYAVFDSIRWRVKSAKLPILKYVES